MSFEAARQRGFSLPELLVALGLTAMIAAMAWPLLAASLGASRHVPGLLERSQTLRGGVVFLTDLLGAAGTGARVGPPAGRLARHLPVVVPRRTGVPAADPVAVALSDRVTVLTVPEGAVGAPLSSPVWAGDTLVTFANGACGPPWLCGLTAGDTALIVDVTGRFEVVRIGVVAPGVATLAAALPRGFDPDHGAAIVPILVRVLYWRAPQRELRVATGGGADLPVLDGVVDFEVRWHGTSAPPAGLPLPAGVAGCLHDEAGVPRLASLGGAEAIVPLDLGHLADGPWCGEGGAAFDADLLRVRRLEVRLRVEATADALRGVGAWFRRAGQARGAHLVPDWEVRFDVAPDGVF